MPSKRKSASPAAATPELEVPKELLDKMPPSAAYEAAVFPTLDEQGAAKKVITEKWDAVVGANVQ